MIFVDRLMNKYLAFVASHTCTKDCQSAIANRKFYHSLTVDLRLTIYVAYIVPNPKVSDTTGDDKSYTAGNTNIFFIAFIVRFI